MRKFTKFVAVLFIIALIFGCASSKSSTTSATGTEQKPSEAPSATIHFESYQFMAILEGGWGMEPWPTRIKSINLKHPEWAPAAGVVRKYRAPETSII